MKKNNKGFSLVELIIVIAIMAVLIGLLAPQYLKFVKQSKISADISNAQSLATAVNVAFAAGEIGTTAMSGTAGQVAGVSAQYPESKLIENGLWTITVNDDGVEKIELSGVELYPTPDGDWAN